MGYKDRLPLGAARNKQATEKYLNALDQTLMDISESQHTQMRRDFVLQSYPWPVKWVGKMRLWLQTTEFDQQALAAMLIMIRDAENAKSAHLDSLRQRADLMREQCIQAKKCDRWHAIKCIALGTWASSAVLALMKANQPAAKIPATIMLLALGVWNFARDQERKKQEIYNELEQEITNNNSPILYEEEQRNLSQNIQEALQQIIQETKNQTKQK